MNCLWHQCTNVSATAPSGHSWKAYGIPSHTQIHFPALYAFYRPLTYSVCTQKNDGYCYTEHMAVWHHVLSKRSLGCPLQSVFIGIHYHSLELGGACFEKVITGNWYNPLHYESADGILTTAQWSLKCNLLQVRTQYCISLSLLLGCTGSVLSTLRYLAGAIWRDEGSRIRCR